MSSRLSSNERYVLTQAVEILIRHGAEGQAEDIEEVLAVLAEGKR